MFTDGKINDVIVKELKPFSDQRGWLIELFRNDDLKPEYLPAMSYISETRPGVTRGPHEHVDQADLFCFIGPSTFKVYLWDARESSETLNKRMVFEAGESNPMQVIIPKGVIHAYKNIGQRNGWVINAPNRLYAGEGKKEPVDEIRHEDIENSPFILD